MPIVFASYSGLLGGAERVLLDCATRLERPVAVACPPGPLAAALAAAGVERVALKARPLALGPAHAAGLVGMARELSRVRAGVLVAWGARAAIAAALLPRRPPLLAVHHDLQRSRAVREAVRLATRRADA
ncbi:MAG TPA: hypothetical protein VFG79_20095, partial [Solirubrobacter sp.]|nr:hypothetical protein [Solirubrobacter sp.]